MTIFNKTKTDGNTNKWQLPNIIRETPFSKLTKLQKLLIVLLAIIVIGYIVMLFTANGQNASNGNQLNNHNQYQKQAANAHNNLTIAQLQGALPIATNFVQAACNNNVAQMNTYSIPGFGTKFSPSIETAVGFTGAPINVNLNQPTVVGGTNKIIIIQDVVTFTSGAITHTHTFILYVLAVPRTNNTPAYGVIGAFIDTKGIYIPPLVKDNGGLGNYVLP